MTEQQFLQNSINEFAHQLHVPCEYNIDLGTEYAHVYFRRLGPAVIFRLKIQDFEQATEAIKKFMKDVYESLYTPQTHLHQFINAIVSYDGSILKFGICRIWNGLYIAKLGDKLIGYKENHDILIDNNDKHHPFSKLAELIH